MLFRKRHSNPTPDNVANTQLAIQQAENSIRILQESSTILQETTNVDTFFSRLEVFENQVSTLQKLSTVVPLTVSPDELAETLLRDKQKIIHDFITRCFNATDEKASQMKTDKGRKNQYQKLYDSFQPYLHLMDENNVRYIEDKCRLNA